MSKRLKVSLICVLLGVFSIVLFLGLSFNKAGAVDKHTACGENYCLVCDVAEKINALPSETDITIDNAAAVIQQINDIDRIKYDLTDSEFFDELVYMVDTHDNGVDHFVITKYDNAVKKIEELTGVYLAITKSFDLGAEGVSDTSETEVTFEITNLDTSAVTTLKLFDLGAGVSSLGAEYYSMTSDGWTFLYKMPAGNYNVTEINQNAPVTINGKTHIFHLQSITVNGTTESGTEVLDGMDFALTTDTAISLYNVKCMNNNPVANQTTGEITGDCGVCGANSWKLKLTAPNGELIADGTTEYLATVEETADVHHFDSANYDCEITLTYEYKENETDAYAVATNFTQAGYYKATLKLNNYFEEVEVFVEYQVLEVAPPNDGGESGSEPMPPESEGTENLPSSESGKTIIEKLLTILEENMFIVATTGFAVLSIFIVFGMTMSFKKKD